MPRQPRITADALRALKRARPFGRHTVRTRDGESFDLTRPDWMLVDPCGDFLTCYDDRERPHFLNVRQIVSIEPTRPKKSSKDDAAS